MILIDENHSVCEVHAIFVTQLIGLFMHGSNIKPGTLRRNYGGFKHSQQYLSGPFFVPSEQYPSDDTS